MPTHLPRKTPESQGVSSTKILEFIDAVEKDGHEFHGFVFVRHGNVIAEGWWTPYSAAQPHVLYSYSKSFTSTAAGFLVDEGRLSLDAPVTSFFPEELPKDISPQLAAMKVRHILSMASGHTEEPPNKTEHWIRNFFEKPVTKEPGTHFLYNSMATYMVSAIVQKITGQRVTEYLEPRLFQPLRIDKLFSERCPRGVDIGGWGMMATTEDMAKLALLYHQKGMWNGKRVLSEAWVETATSKHVSNGDNKESDWCQGYGFQFWRSKHGAFRGDGAFGQYGIVMPAQNAVIAINSFVADMQKPLNLIWEILLPAFSSSPLPENKAAQQALADRVEKLNVPAPQGTKTSKLSAKVSGVKYTFEPNDQKITAVKVDFGANDARLTLSDDRGDHIIELGYDEWKRGTTTFKANFLRDRLILKTATKGGWTSEDTFTFKLALYETPFGPNVNLKFSENGVSFDMQGNIGFGASSRPKLEGKGIA